MGNTNSGSTFNDRLPVDYTLDNVDDDGLINLQTYKRRPLREAGLPHRKANSRRVIERAERRRSRAYHSLSSKLNEAEGQQELDKVWLKQFEVCTSVDIPLNGFKSTTHKNEIRHLLNNLFFKNLDLQSPALMALRKLKSLDLAISKLNAAIDILRTSAPNFSAFYRYGEQDGFGPGEVLMYYLIDGVTLAGTESSGDLALGNKSYELKAVVQTNSGYIKEFRISIETAAATKNIMNLCRKANIDLPAERAGESIPSSALDELRASPKFKDEFAKLELEYATLAYNNYFKKHPIIFMDTNKSGGGGKLGRVMAIMDVKVKDIAIDRISQGKPKPMVKTMN